MGWALSIKPEVLHAHLGTRHWPHIIDVRRANAFEIAEHVLPTATWRNHREAGAWGEQYRNGGWVVVYCAHGEQLSQGAAALLRAVGVNAIYLEGGISAWRNIGGATIAREKLVAARRERPSRWAMAPRHSVEHLACPWLVRRFLDPQALFVSVEAAMLATTAQEFGALTFAAALPTETRNQPAPGGFSALMRQFGIADAALDRLGALLQAANVAADAVAADATATDAAATDATNESVGLAALAQGLVRASSNEAQLIEGAHWVFDALYRWLCDDRTGVAAGVEAAPH